MGLFCAACRSARGSWAGWRRVRSENTVMAVHSLSSLPCFSDKGGVEKNDSRPNRFETTTTTKSFSPFQPACGKRM